MTNHLFWLFSRIAKNNIFIDSKFLSKFFQNKPKTFHASLAKRGQSIKMFITVRFGNDNQEIFNPDCRIVNLINDIRNKCRIDEKQIVDLTDETGS